MKNCEPSISTKARSWHWLILDEAEGPMPLRWNDSRGVWQFGTEDVGTPEMMSNEGWRYIAPCDLPQVSDG